jgi:NAD(P)-dependent dehydrogenase (short-subunit alcohol dehydrogenase family)
VPTDRFVGKVALVTGAASGIGAATATAFASRGAAVLLADLDERGGSALAARLAEDGAAVQFVRTDVTDPADVAAAVRAATDAFGALDCAANVAGGMAGGDRPGLAVHETDETQWDGTVALNLRATWLCMKAEIGHMLEHGGGAIVNVASVAGMIGARDASVAYAVAKAGVIHLTRIAAVTYAERGIRVNAIAPGLTATPAVRASLSQAQKVPRGHAIKRMVEPEEQAEAILWLCSEGSAMTTGHVLPVDGGWTSR